MSDPCTHILDMAERRFSDYGFHKTTMSEIAADCSMSVGNLYRHYQNKAAIAAASVQRCHAAKLTLGLDAMADQNDTLSRLNTFLIARLIYAHGQISDHRHLFELIEVITSEHADVLMQSEQEVIRALAMIIQQGMDAGEVCAGDAQRIAYILHQSLLRYNHPLILKNHTLDVLKVDLCDSVALFYTGLSV